MNYRIEQLRFLLREDPSSRVFYQLAELLRKDGQLTEAVEILRNGLERHPRYVAAWVSLGRAHMQLENSLEAEEAFHKALDLDPQNAVAARNIGETAIALRDWPRAAKSLKLARELAPSDFSLEERISFVEAQMARGFEPPRTGEPVEPSVRRDRGRDTPASRIPRVISLSKEDPFAVSGGGDTGVWQSMQEVFAAGEAIAAKEVAAERADERPAASEPEPELEPEPEFEPDFEPDGDLAEPLPLPTMTLARLAIEQADMDLAESTLVSLLERDPEHPEAGDLLAEIRQIRQGRPSREQAAARVAALQGWLDVFRRAAERQKL